MKGPGGSRSPSPGPPASPDRGPCTSEEGKPGKNVGGEFEGRLVLRDYRKRPPIETALLLFR